MILEGNVIVGQKIANNFGVATANIDLFDSKLEQDGVYFVECVISEGKEKINGIMHYGKRKTVDDKFSVEVHLFNFSREIYGESMQIEVLKRLRDIEKFPSIEELFNQIKKDIVLAKKFFFRRKVKNIWNNLSAESREILEKKAFEEISQMDLFLNSKNIFIYAPKGDEIDFVEEICERFTDKNYFFPKIINGEMKFFRGIFAGLKVGKWGILEPEITEESFPQKEDLIFVPAVATDFDGNRLGNGGGFYDKFLTDNHAKKICVLPEFSVFDEIPMEKHDENVGKIVIV